MLRSLLHADDAERARLLAADARTDDGKKYADSWAARAAAGADQQAQSKAGVDGGEGNAPTAAAAVATAVPHDDNSGDSLRVNEAASTNPAEQSGGGLEPAAPKPLADDTNTTATKGKAKAKPRMPRETALANTAGQNWGDGTRTKWILEARWPEFVEAKQSPKPADARAFYNTVTNEYLFRIDIEYDTPFPGAKEPTLPLPAYDRERPPVKLLDDATWSEEKKKEYSEYVQLMGKKIKAWYTNREHRITGGGKKAKSDAGSVAVANIDWDAYFTAHLSGIAPPPQRALPAYQRLMKESFKEIVRPAMEEKWAKRQLPPNATEEERNAPAPTSMGPGVAAELMKMSAHKALREELEARSQAIIAQQRAEYKEKMDALDWSKPKTRQTAIERIPIAVGPMLARLRAYTGFNFILLGGGPIPKYGGEIRTRFVVSGKNKAGKGVGFDEWYPHFERDWQSPLKSFLETCYTDEQKAAVAMDPAEIASLLTMGPTDDNADDDSMHIDEWDDQDADDGPEPSSSKSASSKASSSKAASYTNAASNSTTTAASSKQANSMATSAVVSKRKRVQKGAEEDPSTVAVDQDDASDSEEDRERRREFARQRNANIIRNRAALAAIIAKEKESVAPAIKPRPQPKPRLKKAATDVGPLRRSARHAGKDGEEGEGEGDSSGPDMQVDNSGDEVPHSSEEMDIDEGDINEHSMGEDERNITLAINGVIDVPPVTPTPAEPTLRELVPATSAASNTTPVAPVPEAATPVAPIPKAAEVARISPHTPTPDTGASTTPRPAYPGNAGWFTQAMYGEIATEDLGGEWSLLLSAFLQLEAAWGWRQGTGSLNTEHRPAQVGAWVKNRRKATTTYCGITNLALYEATWWRWWTGNQPNWRSGVVVDGVPEKTAREGRSWDGLLVAGQNGMLSVVASLYWWGSAQKSATWLAAVDDVTWVMQGLAQQIQEDEL